MKRRRSSAPGRRGPDGRELPLILFLVLAALVAACGQATSTDSATPSDEPSATEPASPSETSETPSGGPTSEPTDTAAPTSPDDTSSPSTPPIRPGSASACSGSDENRDFFASMAAAVDWTVYCPVLPDGWFVDDGQYRLANGGWMEITYDGPSDAALDLRQGALGDAAGGCFQPGPEVGQTSFGDQMGVLVQVTTGGWAVVADHGESICWMILVTGLGDAEVQQIAASLHTLAD